MTTSVGAIQCSQSLLETQPGLEGEGHTTENVSMRWSLDNMTRALPQNAKLTKQYITLEWVFVMHTS